MRDESRAENFNKHACTKERIGVAQRHDVDGRPFRRIGKRRKCECVGKFVLCGIAIL